MPETVEVQEALEEPIPVVEETIKIATEAPKTEPATEEAKEEIKPVENAATASEEDKKAE